MRAKASDTYRIRLYDGGKVVSAITDNMFTSIRGIISSIILKCGHDVNNKYKVEITNLDTEEHGWYSIKGRKIN